MHRIVILLLILTLTACGQKSGQRSVQETINNANYFLGLAKTSEQPKKSEYLLKAGTILAQKAQYLKAQETFSFLNPEYLSDTDKESYYLYYGLSLLNLSQNDAALKFFKRITQPQQHSIDWQITYRKALSQAYLNDGNYYEAAKIRIELEDLLLTEQQITDNHQFIWDALSQISEEFLKLYQTDFSDPIINGWLDIAYLTRKNANQPEQLLHALNLWKQRYPLHPANVQMPEELQQVANAKLYKPQQIALLLPLSGRLAAGGRMIRDGFLAAHYNADQASKTIIKVYDTAQNLSPLTTYQQAVDDGADFIVGPLTKEAVEKIAAQESLAVPQLSLNRADNSPIMHKELYQFGLPIEDEAQQIAKLAIAKNHQTAIVLAPINEQGERTVESFNHLFTELGGQIAEVQRYDDPQEIKLIVKRLLNIDLSETRSRTLEQITGKPLEYVQRRRQDADMVFLSASSNDARRIKPFLDYYFAHDLPVYSVSRLNSGSQNRQLNNDLNDITFTDSPILVSESAEMQQLRQQLSEVLPNINSSFGRLFALGYDAYTLLPELNILQAFKQHKRQGLSGKLSVTPQGRIERTLSIARFEKGAVNEVIAADTETKKVTQ
jgi:hypothetical protein